MTDELTQAAIYGKLIRQAACDADIAEVSFFGFSDDGLRTGFQAALQRADGTPRPAAAAVQGAIAETAEAAPGNRRWEPGVDVVGAQVAIGALGRASPRALPPARTRGDVCVRSVGPVAAYRAPRDRGRAARPTGAAPAQRRLPRARVGAGARRGGGELQAEANITRRTFVVRHALLKRRP